MEVCAIPWSHTVHCTHPHGVSRRVRSLVVSGSPSCCPPPGGFQALTRIPRQVFRSPWASKSLPKRDPEESGISTGNPRAQHDTCRFLGESTARIACGSLQRRDRRQGAPSRKATSRPTGTRKAASESVASGSGMRRPCARTGAPKVLPRALTGPISTDFSDFLGRLRPSKTMLKSVKIGKILVNPSNISDNLAQVPSNFPGKSSKS